jgi:type VI secretion system secreted protein Hcp
MAIDAYMAFQQYAGNAGGPWLTAESQVTWTNSGEPLLSQFGINFPPKQGTVPNTGPGVFEIEDFSFDVEQTLNIGSGGSGAGAGKITFNPFSITRKIDKCSPIFYQMACSGTPFAWVMLALRKSSGGTGTAGVGASSGLVYLRFDFKLVAVKTIGWAYDDESPKETVTFEYGGLMVSYSQQQANGSMMPAITGGWNRVNNIQDTTGTVITQV